MTAVAARMDRIRSRKSWRDWFGLRVHRRQMLNEFRGEMGPHALHAWLEAMKPTLPIGWEPPEITCHAPWLNAEAIAYRRAVGSKTVNGFYIG